MLISARLVGLIGTDPDTVKSLRILASVNRVGGALTLTILAGCFSV